MSKLSREERMSLRFKVRPNQTQRREHRLEREEIPLLLEQTHAKDPTLRKVAANNLCPCHIQGDVPEVWERLLEMTKDPDPKVRSTVLHALTDGSPRERSEEIYSTIEQMYHDPDRKLRRRVRSLLAQARQKGSINLG